MTLASLRLRKNADRRLKSGHLWIYSNEVDIAVTPLKEMAVGQQVVVEASNGRAIATAYVNPNTLICGRIISQDPKQGLDKSLMVHRIKIALGMRERVFPTPHYRLVYGESDLLPGLVVDRFGDVLSVQLNTAGMQALEEDVLDALEKVLKPTAIVLRNDGGMRKLEGLEEEVRVARGELPDEVFLEENGVKFHVPILTGQKTGWFYDHRMNRARMQQYCKGKKVLDLFSYVGGWGVQAAAAGASSVLCVDASAVALDEVEKNAALNNVTEKVTTMQGDAFEALKQLIAEGEKFDVIVLDPPAFIKRRKDIANGERAYERINQLAMRLLDRDGILISASCSMHLAYDRLIDIVRGSARHIDRQAQILEQGHQGPDHPVQPAIPETDYLKSLIVRVFRD
ncbi:SAM-dependent methyltransferase [Oceanospirillum multiglobuliferum]|uniref:rRNA large subunit methyltransferase I n=1 Tax=Oceanospirillum multiglobuliferum TaxID=64969 RepID=A0A1T4SMH9_9GAMM|nr:class I SAM-dependent rRNA methyltransferase [Oceanospirillum multiglobuliferum]OPX54175.1 rRNA large subunit methyltransferase I [Oceanospirillum multiglobuliferum]SKA29385.1 SAM-dependent methyltransferase [Oceanospirillum multiglobuliferum]